MNKVYKIIKPIMLVIIVLLGVIALLSIYNAGYKQLTDSDYAFLFDYSSHEVNEENMAPDYNRGDLAIIGLGGYGAAFAFPCRLLFAGECEVLHYRIRCDELSEAIEGELRSFDSEREK